MSPYEDAAGLAITFIIAVNDQEVFKNNFLASPCLLAANGHEVIVQEAFSSATKAYNDALGRSANDLVVFCHQDVYLPEGWVHDLTQALAYLAERDPNWGVLGCSGITINHEHWRYLYSSGLGVSGSPLENPKEIQTLDEIVLILRRSSGLKFDEELPHYHLYGTDICMQAAQKGMRSYAISAFCIHNTHQPLVLPTEFYRSCQHIRRAWKNSLPIQTTCVRITKFGLPIYARRFREIYLRHIRRKKFGGLRVKDVRPLIEECARVTSRCLTP